MTDRIKGFVVTLDKDYRVDDVEEIRKALLMIKGVAGVNPSVAGHDDLMNRVRIRIELHEKLFDVLRDKTFKGA